MAAITSAIIGAGTAIYGASRAKKQQKKAQEFAQQQMEQMDPFGKYRDQYAGKLNSLMSDPSYLENTAAYKMRLQAAARTMASQGYTGSGNANFAAADAAALAYQQEFDNLAMLSGAAQGQGARASAYGTASGAMGNANDNYLSALSGVANNITYGLGMYGNQQNSYPNLSTVGIPQAPVLFNMPAPTLNPPPTLNY